MVGAELLTTLRERLREYPIEQIAKTAKMPTVDVIRFMDGGNEPFAPETVAKLAAANLELKTGVHIDLDKVLASSDGDNCQCPKCALRRLIKNGGVVVTEVSLAELQPKPEEKTVAEGLDWDSIPIWFSPACAAISLVLSVVAIAIAMSRYQ